MYTRPSQIGCLTYFHTRCGLSANSGCRSETCCTRLAENTGRIILRYFTEFGICRAHCVKVYVDDVVVKKVHVRYVICW